MHDADPITWVNSVLPMAILAALAVLVPLGLVRKQTRSQAEVAVTICASAGIMLLVSALTFAILYAAQGTDVWPAFKVTPIATTWAFIRISGYAALLWLPILALTWFGMAQGVERRKGEDAAKER